MWIITFLYWLQAFAAPVILLGLAGIFSGSKNLFYILLAAGVAAGLFLAECIRRKIGLEKFFGRIYGNRQMEEDLRKKNQDKTL